MSLVAAGGTAHVASASAAPSALTQTGERVQFWAKCGKPRYRPARIYYYCGGASAGGKLRGIRWSTWSARKARGRGRVTVRVFGVPNCSFFCFRTYRARIYLSEPRYCASADRQIFRRFEVRFRNNEGPSKFAVRFGCDGLFVGTRGARASSKSCGRTYGGDVIAATNRLSCSKARAIVRSWARGFRRTRQPNRTAYGYRCRGNNDSVEGLVVRCRRGTKVVRFYANVPS